LRLTVLSRLGTSEHVVDAAHGARLLDLRDKGLRRGRLLQERMLCANQANSIPQYPKK